MTIDANIDWQQLYRCRQSVADQFGDIWSVPVARRYHQVLAKHGRGGIRLLEVGAGDRALKDKMQGYWGDFSYRSCDIDPTYQHDFDDIEAVEGDFELICAFELIEHLTLPAAGRMAERMHELLVPGGVVVLTTPNIFYPPAFMRDATHITPFCYDELGGLLKLAGFEVREIRRLHHDSLVKKFARRILLYPWFRGMGIDFAKQIIVVAEKA
jgi:SAM-dependent methyltransferase